MLVERLPLRGPGRGHGSTGQLHQRIRQRLHATRRGRLERPAAATTSSTAAAAATTKVTVLRGSGLRKGADLVSSF